MKVCASSLPSGPGKLIDDVLQMGDIKQTKLARRAGIPRSVINAYRKGSREPGSDALMRIAAAAGLEIKLVPRTAPVDPERASRILEQVLDLAQALPFHRGEDLEYPRLPGTAQG